MKRQLAYEFSKHNDIFSILTERVKRLESERTTLGSVIGIASKNQTTATDTTARLNQ